MENMSLSDIAAVTGNEGFGGMGGAWWVIILFVILFGGGMWNNNNGNSVTEAGLCTANNFVGLENAVGRLNDQQQQQTMTLNDAVLNATYQTQSQLSSVGKDVALAQANLQLQSATNAAETQRAIDGVNYNVTQDMAAINANTTAQVQKVLDTLQQNVIAGLQQQVNQLQLQNAMFGVVRYPTASTFSAGFNPYFNPNAMAVGANF